MCKVFVCKICTKNIQLDHHDISADAASTIHSQYGANNTAPYIPLTSEICGKAIMVVLSVRDAVYPRASAVQKNISAACVGLQVGPIQGIRCCRHAYFHTCVRYHLCGYSPAPLYCNHGFKLGACSQLVEG